MKRHTGVTVVLIAVLLAGCLAAYGQDEPKSAPRSEAKLTNWYKIEIVLSEFEDGKKTNTRSYTLDAEENGREAVMKLGDRVPVATGAYNQDNGKLVNTSFQYIDVGLNITAYVRERQGRLGLTVAVDQSGVATPSQTLHAMPNQPMIRQLRMENTAFVTLGKPTLISSVDDPGKSNHKYTVEATITKLNP